MRDDHDGRGSGCRVARWYDSAVPPKPPNPHGGRPLDPDRPDPETAQSDAGSTRAGGDPAPGSTDQGDAAPGLRQQLNATKDALVAFVRAHVELAKAEAGEIAGEVKRAAALGGIAVACLLFLLVFLPTGLFLFLGEWLFGSIGWGLLHASELLVDVAVLAALLAIRASGLVRALAIAALVGAVLAIVLGADLFNRLWGGIGDATGLGAGDTRPLFTGIVVLGVVGGLLGLAVGAQAAGPRGALGGLVAGLVGGAILGAFSAITFGPRVGVALGIAIGLAAWPILMGLAVSRQGINGEMLKARFWPTATIDTAKETIEWAKSRTPLGPRS
jgi:hypothetical protein